MLPPDRMRWWVLAAGALAGAIVASAPLLLRKAPVEPPPQPAAPRSLDVEAPPLPIPPPPLAQGELVAAALRAAAAQARGEPAPEQDRELVGRRFLVEIPFGCAGVREDEVGGWAYDAERGVLTLQARAADWTREGWVRLLAGSAGVDAVEGFWLPRREGCAGDGAEIPAALGLAMYFEPNSSRLLRRDGRPYDFTGRAPPPSSEGYRLVVAGRVVGFDDAQPVRCRKDTPADRPVCLAAVAFERVAFDDPATGQTLAEWRLN